MLPLRKDLRSIAVIGPNAASTRNMQGDYAYTAHMALQSESVPMVTILEGIQRKVGSSTEVRYALGCDYLGSSNEGFAQAVETARRCDVVVVVVGGRSGLQPGTNLRRAPRSDGAGTTWGAGGAGQGSVRYGTRVVVVVVDGRPVTLGWIAEYVSAIVFAWLPGEEGGSAVADVLFGDYNPAGRLPVTFPRAVGQVPVNYNRKQSSHKDYVFTSGAPLFPFGHGLSYTTFEYRDLRITPKRMKADGEVRISVRVRNTGAVAGDEVAQLYVRDVVASLVRPVKELKGFERITLQAGEEKVVTFTLPASRLAFYGLDLQRVVESGAFEVMIGCSSEDIRLRGTFEVI